MTHNATTILKKQLKSISSLLTHSIYFFTVLHKKKSNLNNNVPRSLAPSCFQVGGAARAQAPYIPFGRPFTNIKFFQGMLL